jgi:sporulation protein YlmC with PRC-barrel domain
MAFEEEKTYNHLEELNGSGYKIVEGEPDITGWEVVDGEGSVIGEVEDVLFDPQTRDVRYIIIDLAENELDVVADKKVLVPIGIAELSEDDDDVVIDTDNDPVGTETDEDEDDEVVYLPTVTAAHLLALPAYEKGKLSPENETAIRSVFEAPVTDAIVLYEPGTFYTHEHFNNKIFPRNDQPISGKLDQMDTQRQSDIEGGNREQPLL